MVDHASSLNPMKLLIDDHLFENAGSPAFTATGVSVNPVLIHVIILNTCCTCKFPRGNIQRKIGQANVH